jgi:hypothetical protein
VLVPLAITGKLAVIANDGAAIEVDGQAVGTSRWGGELLPGPHAVRVTLAGKKPHQASVDVTARSLRTVEVALEDEASPSPMAVAPETSTHWGWWVAGAVAAGAAATVAYVLLAPTPAQGTRDPGTLGAVNLPLVAW